LTIDGGLSVGVNDRARRALAVSGGMYDE
jgi:hypothetical protein